MVVVSTSMMLTIGLVGLFIWVVTAIICNCVEECKRLEVTHNTIEDREERNNVQQTKQ